MIMSRSTLLELPHTSTGDTDWNTLGNILTAKILGEVLCASYVDRAYGQGRKGFEPDTDWKFMYKEDDVVALQKTFKDSPVKAFMGRGVIDRPMEDIVHFLETHERRKEWDKYLVEIRQVKAMSENDFILYMRVVTANCLVKLEGEFVQYERMAYVDDKYVRTVMSVELPEEFPRKRSILRGELQPGTGWVLEPFMGSRYRTLVSYLAHVDLRLPVVVINRVMRRQPKAIHRIRKILTHPRRRSLSVGSSARESSSDSFTISEQKAVWAASKDHATDPSLQEPYTEELSIDEFIGQRDARFLSVPPVIKYQHETDGFSKTRKIGRSVSVDSAPKSYRSSGHSSLERESGARGATNGSSTSPQPPGFLGTSPQPPGFLGTSPQPPGFLGTSPKPPGFLDTSPKPPGFLDTSPKPPGFLGTSPQPPGFLDTSPKPPMSHRKAVDVIELPIDSNPLVAEDTGFRGDSHLPLSAPPPSTSSVGSCSGGGTHLGSTREALRLAYNVPPGSVEGVACNGRAEEEKEDHVCALHSLPINPEPAAEAGHL